jgi:hypothetical protein
MTSNAPQAKAPHKAARRSLADLAATSAPIPAATGAVIEQKTTAPAPAPAPTVEAKVNQRAKYPSATVYIPPRAIRLLKEISLEENRRITDLLSEALNDWLVRKGHPSLEQLGQ